MNQPSVLTGLPTPERITLLVMLLAVASDDRRLLSAVSDDRLWPPALEALAEREQLLKLDDESCFLTAKGLALVQFMLGGLDAVH